MGALRVAARQLEQRQMPRQVTVQLALPVIALQPVLDKAGTTDRIARLEETMDALVRRMRIAQIACERALDQPGPFRYLPGFDVGPAEITEKPPVVTLARRQFFKQRQLRLVMIAAPAESQQPEHAECQR